MPNDNLQPDDNRQNPEPPSGDCGAMPSSASCEKCGSSELETKFIEAGKYITAFARHRSPSEFVRSSEYDFSWTWSASKDHLHNTCKVCGYEWRSATKDSLQNAELTHPESKT